MVVEQASKAVAHCTAVVDANLDGGWTAAELDRGKAFYRRGRARLAASRAELSGRAARQLEALGLARADARAGLRLVPPSAVLPWGSHSALTALLQEVEDDLAARGGGAGDDGPREQRRREKKEKKKEKAGHKAPREKSRRAPAEKDAGKE